MFCYKASGYTTFVVCLLGARIESFSSLPTHDVATYRWTWEKHGAERSRSTALNEQLRVRIGWHSHIHDRAEPLIHSDITLAKWTIFVDTAKL